MEILFLSVTLATPAVVVGLQWMHSARNCCNAPMGVITDHVGEHQAALEESAANLAASMDAVMACLERIERKVDQL